MTDMSKCMRCTNTPVTSAPAPIGKPITKFLYPRNPNRA